jgi:hypothetical protein
VRYYRRHYNIFVFVESLQEAIVDCVNSMPPMVNVTDTTKHVPSQIVSLCAMCRYGKIAMVVAASRCSATWATSLCGT